MNDTEVKLNNPYVEYRDGVYWVTGKRVSLDSIVYRWREGLSPETIQGECFPVLTLAEVFGALAFYLDHQDEIDEYIKKQEAEKEIAAQQLREEYPEIHHRLDEILKDARNRSSLRAALAALEFSPGFPFFVFTQLFARNGCPHSQPADAGDSIKPGVERVSAEPQECGVSEHQARGAGGSFSLFAISLSSRVGQWLSPAPRACATNPRRTWGSAALHPGSTLPPASAG
jgi:uncharacterized protein (DUF433 family)